ncbi:MAG: KEOPS complex subunit Cgi121 [archaeon]
MTSKSLGTQIGIVGFSGTKIGNVNVFLERFKEKKGNATIQLFDAKNIAGPQHLYFAAVNALNAFAKKTNISNNIEVECLLFASTQRQITKAVDLLGLKNSTSEIVALILAENESQKNCAIQLVTDLIPGKRDDTILVLTPEKIEHIKNLYEISELEFEACYETEDTEEETLVDLVIERMALLVTKS